MDNATIIEGESVPVTQINLGTFFRIPAVRQVLLLLGVAGSVAAGFAIILWSQTPEYSRLYSDLDGADAAEVVEALRAAEIDFKLNTDTGTVLVSKSRLHDARLELASQGLPQGASGGMDWLKDQSTFGQSQFRENALYQHALEEELARTISYLGSVRDARVHLALPKQSAFIRDRKPASASVMLSLYRGRELESNQSASIVHLIASSVPNLLAGNITVVDQQGRLLSSGDQQMSDALTNSQYKHTERLEQNYKRRIEDLLTPLLGPGRVRAEVVADLDFTVIDETRESFDPNGRALVSESVSNNQRGGNSSVAKGIPGALSNQPPETGTSGSANGAQAAEAVATIDTSSSSTRNFEVDRTISHRRPQTGTIRRLSIAVLVDDSKSDGEDGTRSLEDFDTEGLTSLIKEAVGFDSARGDTIVLLTAPFQHAPEAPLAEEPKIWEKPGLISAVKQVLGVALVFALAFGLIRPFLKNLLSANAESAARISGGAGNVMLVNSGQLAAGGAGMYLPSYDEKVAAARNITGHDPAKVAQLVKKWVGASEE